MKKILVVDKDNSIHSQIAEGYLRGLLGSDFRVDSAGLDPKPVHPLTITVLKEIGVDIVHLQSKSLGHFINEPVDYLISFSNRKLPVEIRVNAKRLGWHADEPSASEISKGELLSSFRKVRNSIVKLANNFVTNDLKMPLP